MVLTEAKSLYHVVWWGDDYYPCSRFVSAVEAEEARDIIIDEAKARGNVADSVIAVKVHDVDGYEVHLVKTVKVETQIDTKDGFKMPYCTCGYGLCFDDVFCGRCGSRLDWESFWE